MDSSGSSPQNGKYTQNSSLISGVCQINNGSVSPERPVGETSFSVPLHPTKRPASNPPPISNQATKGNLHVCRLSMFLTVYLGDGGSSVRRSGPCPQCALMHTGWRSGGSMQQWVWKQTRVPRWNLEERWWILTRMVRGWPHRLDHSEGQGDSVASGTGEKQSVGSMKLQSVWWLTHS